MRGSWCALICCAFGLVAAQPASGQLVALGDSYSAGEGAPPFDDGTAEPGVNTCHRSRYAWPMLLAARIGATGQSFACSGAEVPEVLEADPTRGEYERRFAQIGSLQQVLGAQIVTLTIGGNDAGFATVLGVCAIHPDCDRHYKGKLDAKIAGLRARLPRVYGRIVSAMPIGARLVVAGYPRLFPAKPGESTCAVFGLIDRDEANALNGWGAKMNDAVRAAARDAQVQYVDVSTALAGHEMTCDGEQWVNHFEPGRRFPYSFHPNVRGYRALAERVAPALGAPRRQLLRFDGLGPARFGMTRAELRAVWPAARGCGRDPQFEFDDAGSDGRLVAYASQSSSALTDRMVAIGDRVRELPKAYNRIEPLGRSEPDRTFRLYRVRRGDNELLITAADGAVTGFLARDTERRRSRAPLCR